MMYDSDPAPRLFTSESVSQGHPDKMADRISDAILDHAIIHGNRPRVAMETLVKGMDVVLAGEITKGVLSPEQIEDIVRKIYVNVGHIEGRWGIDPFKLRITQLISEQSPEIAAGVDQERLGAGDQGIMFGYACKESDKDRMPLTLTLAHKLMYEHARVRWDAVALNSGPGLLLGPDAKAQVTLRHSFNDYHHRYEPTQIDTIVLSTQHDPDFSLKDVREWGEAFVRMVLHEEEWMFRKDTKILINPAGTFHQGGPISDAGLTGRKIIVDTYGGRAPHGGGCFSGKDPTKVDRSAAYAARRFAKWLIHTSLAAEDEVLVKLAYAIGQPDPVQIEIDGVHEPRELLIRRYMDVIREERPFSPEGMIRSLDLWQPLYGQTSTFGHFGRSRFVWEQVDMEAPI